MSSFIEKEIVKSNSPLNFDSNEEICINGEHGYWLNKNEELNWKGPIPLCDYRLNEDNQPECIIKTVHKPIQYAQNVYVKHLKPPTPPPHGDLIIKQESDTLRTPAPPIIIRQNGYRPLTPEPIVIREKPPLKPQTLPTEVLTIPGRVIDPPRKVVIERMADMPNKPSPIIIEKWLPYEKQKRRVIYQEEKCKTNEPVKNLVIQWRRPNSIIEQDIKCIGVERVDPNEYILKYGNSLRETHELPVFVNTTENGSCCNSKCTTNYYNKQKQQYFLEDHSIKTANHNLQRRGSLKRHGSFSSVRSKSYQPCCGNINNISTFLVVLRKCSKTGDFGMVIRGGSEFNMSLYVLRLVCGGSASYDERLAPGDEILEINGRCSRTMKLSEAVENMKSRNTVSLLIRRTGLPPPSVSDVYDSMNNGHNF